MRGYDKKLVGKRDLVGAEIGVLIGTHAQEMLETLDLKKLYLIDSYLPRKERLSNMRDAKEKLVQYNSRIVWIIRTSEKASRNIKDNSLDFVYIDACHRYRFVFQDLTLWTPKVKKGGLVGGHDWTTQTVREAVEDYCLDNKIKFKQDGSDWWFGK